nr:LysR family transcriptional regulator [Sphingomonas sanxanigenens]
MIQDVVCAKLLHPILRFGARGGRDHRQVGALARDLHCDGSNAASAAETASLVSRRLARLEEELGIQLLARTTRGATLTEAGGAFRDYAMGVCAGLDAVREAILPEEDLQGLLRITAPLSFVPTIFAPVIADMAVQHPRLQIHASYSDHYVDLVGGGFDCGIRVGYLEDSNLIAKRVGPIYGSLVASPAYVAAHGAPETLEEFLDHEVLMHGTEAWQLMDGDKAVMVRPQGRLKADNIIALMTAAIAGLGIARLPDGIAHEHLASGALIRVLPQHPLPIAGMFVVRPHSPHPARKVRVFTEMLQNFLGSCPFISKPYSDDQP